jgi:hypothetical protein
MIKIIKATYNALQRSQEKALQQEIKHGEVLEFVEINISTGE